MDEDRHLESRHPFEERPRVVVITSARATILTNIDRTIVKAVFFKPLDMPSPAAYVNAIIQPLATS